MTAVRSFFSRHGVRLFAALSALVPILVAIRPDIPWEALIAASAALLGVGVATATYEDRKTVRALYGESSSDEGYDGAV